MTETNRTTDGDIAAIGQRHGISEGAAKALYEALRRGGGGQAQFSHPDLGGMGQWSRGGMTQVGDMFDQQLKDRVAGACQDLSRLIAGGETGTPAQGGAARRQVQGADHAVSNRPAHQTGGQNWWPEGLGAPASSGAQNSMRYACFPQKHRLAIERDGRVTIYDTGHYRLTGFSQQQSTTQDLVFSGPDGTVRTDNFRIV
ncbi:MAG: SHOCT domain-containing protein [Proteobacteria bacterium]|nr:SHOCT domain-containing protein [Pseudomonadota bacterium]